MCVQLCIFLLFLGNGSAYIFHLNGSEYARMPPVFHLDPYETCLHENNDSGIYCYAKFDLVSDEPSDLYTIIKEYSKKTEVHLNHSKLSHGICLTRTCKKFYQRDKTGARVATLEACLNDTMWKNYKLKTRVDDKLVCENPDDKIDLTTTDVFVVVLLSILVVLNLVGSLQDKYYGQTEKFTRVSSLLSCFSIHHNWRKLVSPAGEGPEPRLTPLTGFYGIKTISIMLVIMFHSLLPFVMNCDNTHYIEEGYNMWFYQIVVNGTLVVQSFFVMSGFLLSYNIQIEADKHKISWLSAPQFIINRWMRLSPPYIVVLAVTATWLRYFGSGPLWQTTVISEVDDCRRDWWYHLLYINNYVDHSHCLIHSWYLAADFQLYCVGVLVCILTNRQRRKVILALLFVVALLAPAVHTYLEDLNGTLMITPEMARNFFIMDPTFIHTYKRGHTNLASFVIGLTIGLLVYHWQTTGYKLHRYIRHRFVFWMILPVGLGLVLLGRFFYRDAPRDTVYLRMLYAVFAKPLWGIMLGYFIVGLVFQYEDTYRAVIEWPGWAAPSRVSYCAYLLHMTIIRVLTGTRTTTTHTSFLHLLEAMTSSISISFLAAIPFHLVVEAPFLELRKRCIARSRDSTSQINNIMKSDVTANRIYNNAEDKRNLDEKIIGGIAKAIPKMIKEKMKST